MVHSIFIIAMYVHMIKASGLLPAVRHMELSGTHKFLEYTIFNKITACVDKLVEKKQCQVCH